MKTTLLSLLFLIFISPLPLEGFDFILEKNPLSGTDVNKNYSIIRNNANDGFILCGSSFSLQGIAPTIISIKDNGFVNWSKSFVFSSNKFGHAHAICPNFDSSGYVIVGQYYESGKFNSHGFVMEITEIGTLSTSFSSAMPGGFSNIKNTLDSGYLITGFTSADTALFTPNREAMICKFDSDLNLSWGKTFISAEYEKHGFKNRYEHAEVIVNFISPTSERQMHFVAGSYTTTGLLGKQVPAMVYFLLDENGMLVSFESTEKYFTPVDAIYDSNTKKMIVLSNKTFDLGAGSSFGVISIIDPFNSGSIDNKSYKVYASGTDVTYYLPQLLSFHKITHFDGKYKTFGYVRKLGTLGEQVKESNFPFYADFNPANFSNPISKIIIRSREVQSGYLSDNTGLWGTAFSETDGYPSGLTPPMLTPDMGCSFLDKNNVPRFGMISYCKIDPITNFHSLHLLSSMNNSFCFRQDMYLQLKPENLGGGGLVKLNNLMVLPKNNLLMNSQNITYFQPDAPDKWNMCTFTE
jgi:hypothetical protein